MYKNGSSSLGFGTIEDSFTGDDASEAVAVDEHEAGEESSKESLSVEELTDEIFVWRKERLDPEPNELGDAGCRVKLELEEAHGLGVGWTSH